MLEYVRKREAGEKLMIGCVDPAVYADPDWPLKLSEWKMKYKVHNMTPYQTKRFVKWIHTEKERGGDEKDVDG